jgi:hypothetical protein
MDLMRHLLSMSLVLMFLTPFLAEGRVVVVDRKKHFYDYKKEVSAENTEREKGKANWYNLRQKIEEDRERAYAEFLKTRKKTPSVSDDFGQPIRDWRKEKQKYFSAYEDERKKYLKNLPPRIIGNLSEEEELGLLDDPPRVDYKKRALYNSGLANKSGGSSGGSSNYVPRPSDFGSGYTSPPDFSGDNNTATDDGFLPPPPPPEGFDYQDAPPPPFVPDEGDGFSPPPPPPAFEEEPIQPIY